MGNRAGVDDIGRGSTGRKGFGQGTIGRGSRPEKPIKHRNIEIRTKLERMRDNARAKLLEAREKLKAIVERGERKTEMRKAGWDRNLNPAAVSTMPSYRYAKSLRNPDNLSAVPLKPRYSGQLTDRKRIYGKRFDRMGAKE